MSPKRPSTPSSVARHLLWFWLFLPLLLTLTGCQGCRDWLRQQRAETKEQRAEEEELDKKKDKPKPDFEPWKVTILPGSIPLDDGAAADDETLDDSRLDDLASGDDTTAAGGVPRAQRVVAKPGHWVQARYRLKANNDDFQGVLMAQCVDARLRPHRLEQTPFSVSSTRPAVIPKAQSKDLDLPLFVSLPTTGTARMVQVYAHLRPRGSSRDATQEITPTLPLKSHQYHLVVLARNPDRYGWLRSTPTVRPPLGDWGFVGLQEDYVVTLHQSAEGESLSLPGNPLAWTSIAYVIWDDLPPDALTTDQQAALVDWIHWGGQLLISGPESLDTMRGSFLGDFLPAELGKVVAVSQASLRELNEFWSLLPEKLEFGVDAYRLTSPTQSPLEITPLTPIADASFVPTTGQLVVERRIGRGRIVATAFPLGARRIVNWQNYDGFLNGCLLRRPAREFSMAPTGFPQVSLVGTVLERDDARINCGLRYFSRDARIPGEGRNSDRPRGPESPRRYELPRRPEPPWQGEDDPWGLLHRGPKSVTGVSAVHGYRNDPQRGVAGWSDFTAAATAARDSLQQAAGISIPNAGFVARVLGGYLLCLVPLNWLFFRVLRRVEWAWFVAPLIAVGGAVLVVRLAQLDIGFVRSRTEIAVVESQPGLSRAHVTRFCGLYTSLTSQYTLKFADSLAFALPFSTDPSADLQRLQTRQEVAYTRDKTVGLAGYPVLSNSTGMVHAEQMVNLEGSFGIVQEDADGLVVANGTRFDLQSVVLVTLTQRGVRLALASTMVAGEEATFTPQEAGDGDQLFAFLGNDRVTSEAVQEGQVSLRGLYRLALNSEQMRVGDIRLIGWSPQPVEGMGIRPNSNQNTFRTLLLANLRYGPLDAPTVDLNHPADFRRPPDEEGMDFEEDQSKRFNGRKSSATTSALATDRTSPGRPVGHVAAAGER